MKIKNFIKKLKFNENRLIPVILQDYKNNEVLMMAYMNNKALEMTLKTNLAHFWSRSRKELWLKGRSSGHVQKVKKMYFDCDRDCLLIKIEQVGAACHNGYRSCFYTGFDKRGKEKIVGKKVFDPNEVYRKS